MNPTQQDAKAIRTMQRTIADQEIKIERLVEALTRIEHWSATWYYNARPDSADERKAKQLRGLLGEVKAFLDV